MLSPRKERVLLPGLHGLAMDIPLDEELEVAEDSSKFDI